MWRRKTTGVAALVIGAILVIAGFVDHAVISSKNALCQSPLGQIGSAIDNTVAHDCGLVTALESAIPWLIGLGILGLILGIAVIRNSRLMPQAVAAPTPWSGAPPTPWSAPPGPAPAAPWSAGPPSPGPAAPWSAGPPSPGTAAPWSAGSPSPGPAAPTGPWPVQPAAVGPAAQPASRPAPPASPAPPGPASPSMPPADGPWWTQT